MNRTNQQEAILASSRRQINDEQEKAERYRKEAVFIKDKSIAKRLIHIAERLDVKIREMIEATNDYEKGIE